VEIYSPKSLGLSNCKALALRTPVSERYGDVITMELTWRVSRLAIVSVKKLHPILVGFASHSANTADAEQIA
jgi:hypothetical protein